MAGLLHKEYRHVWCAIRDYHAKSWISYDFKGGIPSLKVEAPIDYDLAHHYELQGYPVVKYEIGDHNEFNPFMFRSCVSMVKHLLGIKTFAVTPWQLFKAVRKQS